MFSPLLLLLLPPFLLASLPPPVTTRQGVTGGLVYESDKISADVYLGIPFAQPPVGELRFKKPVAPLAYDTPRTGNTYQKMCMQNTKNILYNHTSEDCLYLNVLRPNGTSESSSLPVLVWVHGGGYAIGSASIYPYSALCDIYLPHGVIVVSVQYRLGVQGFFSTGDSALPGNLGLWDITEAFKWIQANIASFGGDPSRVTAWGLSAGGSAVSLLTLSPHSRDLFSRAIIQSGSAWNAWSISEHTKEHSLEFAEAVGCGRSEDRNSEEMIACLQKISVDDILEGIDQIGSSHRDMNFLKWTPTYDGDFLPKDIDELVKEAPVKPTIIGITRQECVFFTTMALALQIHRFEVLEQDWSAFTEARFESFIREIAAPKTKMGRQAAEAQELLIDYYIHRDRPANPDYAHWLTRYTDFLTDHTFALGIVEEANMKSSLSHPVHFYLVDWYAEEMFKEEAPVKGSMHTIEYAFLFNLFYTGKFEIGEEEERIGRFLIESMIGLVKEGSPTNSVHAFPRYSPDRPVYVSLNKTISQQTAPFEKAVSFWTHNMDHFEFNLAGWRKNVHKVKESIKHFKKKHATPIVHREL